jgi:hypothetical protein
MLRRNMNHETRLRLQLEEVLASLWHARQAGDLSRVVALTAGEIPRWARAAGRPPLARHSLELLARCPYRGRDELLSEVDGLIGRLEHAHSELAQID